jgi:hypothetical protein
MFGGWAMSVLAYVVIAIVLEDIRVLGLVLTAIGQTFLIIGVCFLSTRKSELAERRTPDREIYLRRWQASGPSSVSLIRRPEAGSC